MVGVNDPAFGFDIWGNDNDALERDGINDDAVIDPVKKIFGKEKQNLRRPKSS